MVCLESKSDSFSYRTQLHSIPKLQHYLFDSIPGAQAYGNVVINNRLKNNGLPGVAMHSHAPGQNLNDNLIVGNYISGNGKDTEDAATPGPTGINVFGLSSVTGTVISENVIDNEAEDIITNTSALVAAHLNDLLGGQIGVDNLGSGTVDATENWCISVKIRKAAIILGCPLRDHGWSIFACGGCCEADPAVLRWN